MAKKPSTAFSHELDVGVKWNVQRVTVEPGAHLVVLVSGIVVEDDVDQPAGRDVALEGIEEADELLMPVALHVACEHRSGQDIERGEQGGGAVALVIMGHGGAAALLQRQSGCGQAPGSATSRRCSALGHGPAD